MSCEQSNDSAEWQRQEEESEEMNNFDEKTSDVGALKKESEDVEEIEEVEIEDEEGDVPWYNRAEYRCQICSFLFFTLPDLIYHINIIHKKSSKKYKREFGCMTTNKISYQCQICYEFMKCDENAIRR